jgi:hypothetical protein
MPLISSPSPLAMTPVVQEQAARRRAALVAAGCSTYTLGRREGLPAIICHCCGLGSTHPRDVRERSCGLCHAVHSEWKEA